jgi:hypothetical protein
MKCSKSGKLQHEDVTVLVWHNSLEVLSTNTDLRTDDNVLKSGSEAEVKIPCPEAVVNYTQNMWGH